MRHFDIFDSKICIFRLSTCVPMDIHLVRVPAAQYVDVVGESQRNEENVPHFFQSMLTAMMMMSQVGHNVHNLTPSVLIIVEKAQFIGIVR